MTNLITLDSLFAAPTEAEIAAIKVETEASRAHLAGLNDLWKVGLDAEAIARIEAMMPREG